MREMTHHQVREQQYFRPRTLVPPSLACAFFLGWRTTLYPVACSLYPSWEGAPPPLPRHLSMCDKHPTRGGACIPYASPD